MPIPSARRGLVVLMFALAAMPAFAATFSTAGSLPGGVAVTDSDTGSGERWGRAGGRNLSFTVNTPGNFGSLSWGVVNGTVPTVALDGSVTANTPEFLNFNASESNLAGGLARWNGSAVVALISGPATIQTRFTLRVTNSSGPVVLTNVSGGVTPGINVLSSGPFTANLLFEGLDNSLWRPLLEYYDGLPKPAGNPPGTTGPAMTGIQTGFYFDATGMSLEDHDRNITQRLVSIKDDTAFLRIDTVGRLSSVSQGISNLQQQISNLPAVQIPQNIATRDDVRGSKDDIQEMLLVLWGIMPCPDPNMCAAIKFVKDLATQASVDSLATTVAKESSVLSLANSVGGRASQLSVDSVASSVNSVGGSVMTRASQASVDSLASTANGLAKESSLTPLAKESSLGLLAKETSLTGLARESSLMALSAGVSGLASQTSVNLLQSDVDGVELKLETVRSKVDALQLAVSAAASPNHLEVEAEELADTPSKTRRWIVKTTRDGVLVDGQLTRLVAIRTAKQPAFAQDVTYLATIVPFSTGLHDVTLQIVKDVSDGGAYQFEVRRTEGTSVILGTALVSAPKKVE